MGDDQAMTKTETKTDRQNGRRQICTKHGQFGRVSLGRG